MHPDVNKRRIQSRCVGTLCWSQDTACRRLYYLHVGSPDTMPVGWRRGGGISSSVDGGGRGAIESVAVVAIVAAAVSGVAAVFGRVRSGIHGRR